MTIAQNKANQHFFSSKRAVNMFNGMKGYLECVIVHLLTIKF